MTQLMRGSLKELLDQAQPNSCHAGLLMQRGLSVWEQSEKPNKKRLIDSLSELNPPPVYQSAFKRWVGITQSNPQFAAHIGQIEGRLYIGLNSAGALETGLSTHHSYGMPMLPGSSVKGAVRHYAESVGLDADICQVLFGSDAENGEVSGALVWHDAWWIPADNTPFVGEIITTHHQDYYNRKKDQADGMESPIPNQQIATRGGFYFCVQAAEGGEAWAQFAVNLLGQMLEQQGMGAKTASGYGYFTKSHKDNDKSRKDNEIEKYVKKQVKEFQESCKAALEQAAQTAELQKLPKHQRWVEAWRNKIKSQQRDEQLYHQFKQDLEDVQLSREFSDEEKKGIAEKLSPNMLARQYPNWINNGRKQELRLIAAQLRGE